MLKIDLKDKNMKVIYILLTLLIVSPDMWAESNISHLIIQFQDGDLIQYALNEKPEISFADDNMEIQTNSATFSYPIYKINQLFYGSVGGSDVEEVYTHKPLCYINEDYIVISGIDKDYVVNIYNTNGIHVKSYRKNMTDDLYIPISDFTIGVYIIKTNDISFKIAIK